MELERAKLRVLHAACGRRLALVGALLLLPGCTPTWDAEALAARRPELAGRDVGRLGDATPYTVAGYDTLIFFLCRFPLGAPLAVSLPPDASAAERGLLRRALEAWEQAVPGLHFAPGAEPAAIRLRFRDDGPEGARTAAECAVDLASPEDYARADPLRARLVAAHVTLRRAESDAWGRPVALSEAEILGSALHELGHALGLQGHARRGPSILVTDVDRVRRVGSRVLAGGALSEDAARALYALPSGLVVARRALRSGATASIDATAAAARRAGLAGPRVRVGDGSARVYWGEGQEPFEYFLREPDRLLRGELTFSEVLLPPAGPPP